MRKYYALTCRISEKKIIEKAVEYYSELVKEYSAPISDKKVVDKKKPAKKRNKKMKL